MLSYSIHMCLGRTSPADPGEGFWSLIYIFYYLSYHRFLLDMINHSIQCILSKNCAIWIEKISFIFFRLEYFYYICIRINLVSRIVTNVNLCDRKWKKVVLRFGILIIIGYQMVCYKRGFCTVTYLSLLKYLIAAKMRPLMANQPIPPMGPWLGAPGRSGGSWAKTKVSILKAIIMSVVSLLFIIYAYLMKVIF